MSATKPRSSDGCWTCRLRRKKCDELRPICAACATLEIDCLYSDAKPDWMDNGEKQKEKADWLKLEVKRLASARREKRHLQSLETSMNGLQVTTASDTTLPPPSTSSANHTPQDSGSESWPLDPNVSSMASSTPPSSYGPATGPNPADFIGLEVPVHRVGIQERDLSFIMLYLDYTFPFLNPFYRPPILDGGRGWLLVTLMRNKALFHIALSLSAYLFAEILKHGTEAHSDCKAHTWDSLQGEQQLAVRELQADMQELNRRGVQGHLAASSHVMSSVLQLLTFEVAIANTGNWQMHIDAASVLFEQIMEHHGTVEAGHICWHKILNQLGDGIVPYSVADRHHPWNADQASVRFFTANLLFFDTLSATALGRAPRLLRYHDHLLTILDHCCDNHALLPCTPHLKLEDFFGVPNWIVRSIANTAALDAWKKEQKKTNSLSMTQLVSRAATIEQTLKSHIVELDLELNVADPGYPPALNPIIVLGQAAASAADPAAASYRDFPIASQGGGNVTARIWAQAALTYLLVVVSGWQPASAEIRESVAVTAEMLRGRLPTPASLRTVVWPFCVTGCLAEEGEEQGFRDLVAALGPLSVFGTVREALAIMERVWEHRCCVGAMPDVWDLSVALNSLGHAALLI